MLLQILLPYIHLSAFPSQQLQAGFSIIPFEMIFDTLEYILMSDNMMICGICRSFIETSEKVLDKKVISEKLIKSN